MGSEFLSLRTSHSDSVNIFNQWKVCMFSFILLSWCRTQFFWVYWTVCGSDLLITRWGLLSLLLLFPSKINWFPVWASGCLWVSAMWVELGFDCSPAPSDCVPGVDLWPQSCDSGLSSLSPQPFIKKPFVWSGDGGGFMFEADQLINSYLSFQSLTVA